MPNINRQENNIFYQPVGANQDMCMAFCAHKNEYAYYTEDILKYLKNHPTCNSIEIFYEGFSFTIYRDTPKSVILDCFKVIEKASFEPYEKRTSELYEQIEKINNAKYQEAYSEIQHGSKLTNIHSTTEAYDHDPELASKSIKILPTGDSEFQKYAIIDPEAKDLNNVARALLNNVRQNNQIIILNYTIGEYPVTAGLNIEELERILGIMQKKEAEAYDLTYPLTIETIKLNQTFGKAVNSKLDAILQKGPQPE